MNSNGLTAAALALAVGLTTACGPADTPEARRARGLELLSKTGSAIVGAQSISFSAKEVGERVKRSGEKTNVTLNHTVQVRRPDRIRLHVEGDIGLEGFYDGATITLLTPKDKVYASVPASGSLDTVIHDTMQRFDIPFPLGDLVTFDGPERLITAETQGGWAGDETIGGVKVAKVAWTSPTVDWSVWVPVEGQPLPVRLEVVYKARRGSPRRAFEISNWQLGAPMADDLFVAKVPEDYEGIPVVQRASAVRDEIEKAKAAAAAGKD